MEPGKRHQSRVQLNGAFGKINASPSWNDGFYSNRYTWFSGSLRYAFNAANTMAFVAGGNLGQTAFQNPATPVQNNWRSTISFTLMRKDPGSCSPTFNAPMCRPNQKIGIARGAATRGGALLVNYRFTPLPSLAGRTEYISRTGSASRQSLNLLFGPGSAGRSR